MEWKRIRTEHNRDRYIPQKAIIQNAEGLQKHFKIANTLVDKE